MSTMDGPDGTVVFDTYYSLITLSTFKGNRVVIKQCKDRENPRTLQRWRTEVRAMKKSAGHSNIALMLASDLETFSMTLRIEAGASVDKYVDPSEHCTLSDLDGQMLLCRMSSALAHLHALNMIHDDVKPDNIVWDPAGKRAVLIDFGAAVDYAIVPRDWFNPSGTPSYVPPEFIDRRKGPEGDIWGLGITMLFVWRLVQLPEHDWLLPGVWDEGGDVALRQWLAEVETLATGDHKHSAILRRMLEQDPDRRISSTELASASVDYMQRRNSS